MNAPGKKEEGGRREKKGYLRPMKHVKHKVIAPVNTVGRFEREVLHCGLWYAQCSSSGDAGNDAGVTSKVEAIPMEFESVDEYIRTFDPLVLEEARETVRSSMVEQCSMNSGGDGDAGEVSNSGQREGGRSLKGLIMGVEQVGAGIAGKNMSMQNNCSASDTRANNDVAWFHVHIGVRKGVLSELVRVCAPNTVVVLTPRKPPSRGVLEWIRKQNKDGIDGDAPIAIAGLCVRKGPKDGNSVTVKIHPVCGKHMSYYHKLNPQRDHGTTDIREIPSCRCISSLRKLKDSVHTEWWVTPCQMLVSAEREFEALHCLRRVDTELMKYILKPRLLKSMAQIYSDDVRRFNHA